MDWIADTYVMVQAAGVWDKDVLQDYMNEVVRQICLVTTE